MNLCLIFGGVSPEHEVSIASAFYCFKTINKYFSNIKVNPVYISKENKLYSSLVSNEMFSYFEKENKTIINKNSLDIILKSSNAKKDEKNISSLGEIIYNSDIVFPLIHGPYGEDGTLQGFISIIGKRIIGFDTLMSSIGMDKVIFKNLCDANNIKVAPYFWLPSISFIKKESIVSFLNYKRNINFIEFYEKKLVNNIKEDYLDYNQIQKIFNSAKIEFSLPFFLKASNLGSSIGVYKIKSYEDFINGIKELVFLTDKILIEKEVKGYEIEISYIKRKDYSDFVSLPGRVIPSEEFYSYNDKYIKNEAKFEIPVKLDEDIIEKFRDITLRIIKMLNAKGFARIDYFYEPQNCQIYCNEINSIPGFTRISMFPQLLLKSGLTEKEIFEDLIYSSLF